MLAPSEFTVYVEEIRRSAEGADEGPEQWRRLRRHLAPHHAHTMGCTAELRHAYEEVTHTPTGCD